MNPASPEVVVIGNAGVDTNIYLYGADIDFSVEANFSQNIDYVGQAGGYAARGYAALGRRTAFIGALGDDACGRMVREQFERDGIDGSGIFHDPLGTARSVNLMYRDGRRKNFYDGKGHMDLRPDLDVCRRIMRGARLAHVNIPNWARYLLPVCRELGMVIACDLQDIVDPYDPYRQDFVHAADILFFSAANHAAPEPIAELYLRHNPARIVIAGMGEHGCLIAANTGMRRIPPPAIDLPVIDANGAGDSLAAGFLTSYVLDGRGLEESAQRGQAAARYACAQRAPKGLIDAAATDRFTRQ